MIAEASEWVIAVLDDRSIPNRRAIDDRAAIGPTVIVGAPAASTVSRTVAGCAVLDVEVPLTVVPRSTESLDDLYAAVDTVTAALLTAGATVGGIAPTTYGADDSLPAYELTAIVTIEIAPHERTA